MKTRLDSNVKRFFIAGRDEENIIPEGVDYAVVNYDAQGKPTSVNFVGAVVTDPSPIYEAYLAQLIEAEDEFNEKMNPPRTREEVARIAERLERTLVIG